MVLIDAANINSGGGESLLNYLLESLNRNNINYFVITDPRWKNNTVPKDKKAVVKVNIFNRKGVLEKFIKLKSPKTLLLFGNFPPPFSVGAGIRTITYIQNNLVVNWDNSKYLNLSKRIYLAMTRFYLNYNKSNSDIYCFQNELTKNSFISSYGESAKKEYRVLPFFRMNDFNDFPVLNTKEESFIFVSSDMEHKNHINLFLAWDYNFRKGMKNKLYITINENSNTKTVQAYKKMKEAGVPIINLGTISQNEVFVKCQQCKFSIFPSFIETIGLNLVESSLLGCKVLASNLPYVNEVLKPSLSFDPYNPFDIANKVAYALENNLPDPIIVIENKIEELIKILV